MTLVRTAYHEAGHALVALAIGLPVAQATIEPDWESLGHVALVKPENTTGKPLMDALTPDQLATVGVLDVAWSMAGAIAENIAFRNVTGGCERDYLSADFSTGRTDEAAGTLSWQWRGLVHNDVENFLRTHWPLVSRLAMALLMEGTITGERAGEIVGNVPKLDLSNAEGGIAYWSQRMAARMSA